MLVNIIKILFVISLASCSKNTRIAEVKVEGNNLNKCHLVQRVVDIDPSIFTPFNDVYKDFDSSKYALDILVKRTGQLSGINRLYQIEIGKFRFLKYNENGLILDKTIEGNSIELKTEIGDYAFLCNERSTDLGTHVYVLKKAGKVVSNMWFENGDFTDLSANDIEMDYDLRRLFYLLHK